MTSSGWGQYWNVELKGSQFSIRTLHIRKVYILEKYIISHWNRWLSWSVFMIHRWALTELIPKPSKFTMKFRRQTITETPYRTKYEINHWKLWLSLSIFIIKYLCPKSVYYITLLKESSKKGKMHTKKLQNVSECSLQNKVIQFS